MVTISVDQKQIEAEPETTLLKACLDNGIYIPHLCFMEHLHPAPASCRMCFVAVEGEHRPVTACTQVVREGMVVQTDTEDVRRLQKAGLQLLLSVHHVDCRNCPANKKCPLQKMARHLKVGLKPGKLERHLKTPEIDRSHPILDYYPNRCVLCGKCVQVCRNHNGQSIFTFARRGFNTVIQYFGSEQADPIVCPPEHECVNACPVAALQPREAEAS
jgi:NADH dehydrogenase/NADH:ubiquinone oxidoreductase subunit G